MALLSHLSIKGARTFFLLEKSYSTPAEGWFREISSQWPGQAMTLKVTKILHVEKSLNQDVLAFESETHGNVLVLDGVIQCTERDEFSYTVCFPYLFIITFMSQPPRNDRASSTHKPSKSKRCPSHWGR
jgi:hypothetical protein